MNTLIVKNYNGVKETPIALYLIGILNFKKYRTKTLLWQQDSSPKNIALASSLGHIVQVGWRTFVKFFTKKSSKGPSINDVTSFFGNFDPPSPPCHTMS